MRTPAEVFPVSHFIIEELEARCWDFNDLLNHMPGDRKLNAIWLDLIMHAPEFALEIRKDLRLGDPTPLAIAFGTSNDFWTNLDNVWMEQQHKVWDTNQSESNSPDVKAGGCHPIQ